MSFAVDKWFGADCGRPLLTRPGSAGCLNAAVPRTVDIRPAARGLGRLVLPTVPQVGAGLPAQAGDGGQHLAGSRRDGIENDDDVPDLDDTQ